jgi:hypothetical protein
MRRLHEERLGITQASAGYEETSATRAGRLLVIDSNHQQPRGIEGLRKPSGDECSQVKAMVESSVDRLRDGYRNGAREAGVAEATIAEELAVWEKSLARTREWVAADCPAHDKLGVIDRDGGGKDWSLFDVAQIGSITLR